MNINKRNITIALMVAMFLGAVEGTVVTTAVPTIAKDLRGFELISWVFSLYLLTSAISTPIYGKLADLFGRKNVLSTGIIIFLVGSCLCGISQNMYQLIGFRTIQGLGAGSIFTVTYTIVGDIFAMEERAKIQGYLSSVWGIASLLGPFLGGFMIDKLSWHWIFFINLPFGLLSIILLQKYLNENFVKKEVKIDYLGTIVLSLTIVILLYGFLMGEKSPLGYGNTVIISIATAGVFLVIFYFVEKGAKEPIIPFDIFSRTSVIVNSISFLCSAVLIGIDVYMPIYIQNVLGFSATISGLTLAPMSVTWLLSSFVLAKAIAKYGEKLAISVSAIIILIGTALLPTLNVSSNLALVMLYTAIMGFGFGGCFTTMTMVIQSSVNYDKRGAATATNSLLRTLGQTISVSILGGLFNFSIVRYFSGKGINGVDPNNIYASSGEKVKLNPHQVKEALNSGLHLTFIILICIIVIGLVLSSRIKKVQTSE